MSVLGRALGALLLGALAACGPTAEKRIAEVRTLHTEGRFAETATAMTLLLEEFPDDPEVNRLYGVTMLAVEHPTLAVFPLRKLVEELDAGLAERMLLAKALRQSGAPDEAFEILEEVLAADPDRVEALWNHAALANELSKHEALLEVSERLLELEPRSHPPVYGWRAKALAAQGRSDEAYTLLEQGMEMLQESADLRTWRPHLCSTRLEVLEAEGGETATDDPRLEEAWADCLEEFPADPKLVQDALEFFDARKERDRATSVIEAAIQAAPRQLDYRSMLAGRLAQERRYDEALEILLEPTRGQPDPHAWLAVADYHRKLDEYAAAVEASERVFELLDEVPVLLVAKYADDCIQAGQLDKAERAIEQIDQPEYASLLRGRILLLRGEAKEALAELREGMRLYQGNATARYLSGQAAERMGDLDLAIAEYRDAVRASPVGSDAAFALARLYEAEGNFSAIQYILQLRNRRGTSDPRVLVELARIHTLYGRNPESARSLIAPLAELPGEETATAVAEARLERRLAGPRAAAAAIESAGLDLRDPTHVDALRALVLHLRAAEDPDAAIESTRAASEAHPDFAEFHTLHAQTLRLAGRPAEEAQAALARALELDPGSAEALAEKGALATKDGRVEEAIALYDRAAEALAPDVEAATPSWRAVELLVEAADAGDATGSREAEIDSRLDALLFRDPIHPGAVNLRARRLVEQGEDLDQAEVLAQRALRFGDDVEALTTLGLLALERGEYERAVRSLRRTVQRRPRSSTNWYHLARALIATENEEAAITALNQALSAGDFPEAEEARAELVRLTPAQEQQSEGGDV